MTKLHHNRALIISDRNTLSTFTLVLVGSNNIIMRKKCLNIRITMIITVVTCLCLKSCFLLNHLTTDCGIEAVCRGNVWQCGPGGVLATTDTGTATARQDSG